MDTPTSRDHIPEPLTWSASIDAFLAAVPARLRSGLGREVATFAVIGVISTAAYAVLYLLLRTIVGPAIANAAALVITAVGNTAANRRLTFGVRDRHSMLRDQLAGIAALGIALAITTASVGLLGLVAPHAGRLVELAVLVTANASATIVRFLLLRTLIGRGRVPQPATAEIHRSVR
jgi:putative flippase GtrA